MNAIEIKESRLGPGFPQAEFARALGGGFVVAFQRLRALVPRAGPGASRLQDPPEFHLEHRPHHQGGGTRMNTIIPARRGGDGDQTLPKQAGARRRRSGSDEQHN